MTGGRISSYNATTNPLKAYEVFVGQAEDVSVYSQIVVSISGLPTTAPCVLRMQFSQDDNWDDERMFRSIDIYITDMSKEPPHALIPVMRYFRVVIKNGEQDQSHFQLQTMYHLVRSMGLISRANQHITSHTDVMNVRAIATGQIPNKNYRNVRVSPEHGLHVSCLEPRVLAGGLDVVKVVPIFDVEPKLALRDHKIHTVNGGSVKISNKGIHCSAGAHGNGAAQVYIEQTAPLHTQQALRGVWTAQFVAKGTNHLQWIGFSSPTDTIGFGYQNNEFGCLAFLGGSQAQYMLELEHAPKKAGNILIRLNHQQFYVKVTKQSNTVAGRRTTLREISDRLFEGWRVTFATQGSGGKGGAREGRVYFLGDTAGPRHRQTAINGKATGLKGKIVRLQDGRFAQEQFVPWAKWNHDKMDGSGSDENPSGAHLHPELINTYRIRILQDMLIRYEVYVPELGNFTVVHEREHSNRHTLPMVNSRLLHCGVACGSTNESNPELATILHRASVALEGIPYPPIRYTTTTTHSQAVSKDVTRALMSLHSPWSSNQGVNHFNIRLHRIQLITNADQPVLLMLYQDATITVLDPKDCFVPIPTAPRHIHRLMAQHVAENGVELAAVGTASQETATLDFTDHPPILATGHTFSFVVVNMTPCVVTIVAEWSLY
jgi:hypothetical protein